MIYAGIDPGVKGWVVAIDERLIVARQTPLPMMTVKSGKRNRSVLDMPAMLRLAHGLAAFGARHGGLFLVLEKAQVMAPGPGGKSPASARSMFNYGVAYGGLKMALHAASIEFVEVAPRTWSSKILKGLPGTTKERSIAMSSHVLPTLDLVPGRKRKPQDGIADAACMCLHGTRIHPAAGVATFNQPSLPRHAMPPLPSGPPDASKLRPPPPPRRKNG